MRPRLVPIEVPCEREAANWRIAAAVRLVGVSPGAPAHVDVNSADVNVGFSCEVRYDDSFCSLPLYFSVFVVHKGSRVL